MIQDKENIKGAPLFIKASIVASALMFLGNRISGRLMTKCFAGFLLVRYAKVWASYVHDFAEIVLVFALAAYLMRAKEYLLCNVHKVNVRLFLAVFTVAAIFYSVGLAYHDYLNMRMYGGLDLRNRIVGARLMEMKYSPYHFKWSNAFPDTLLDPRDDMRNIVNRCTIPPSALMLTSSIANFRYAVKKNIWFFFQYFCIGSIIFLFVYRASSVQQKYLTALAGMALFVNGPAWDIHIKLGQIYIFYTLLVALAFFVMQSSIVLKEEMGGGLLGLVTWLRPPLLLMAFPFVINQKKRVIVGMLMGIAIGGAVSLLDGQLTVWQDYGQAMREWSKDQCGELAPYKTEARYPPLYVEGEFIKTLQREVIHPNWPNLSVQGFVFYLLGGELSSHELIVLFILALVLCGIYWGSRLFVNSYDLLFLEGFLLVMLCEYFMPAARYRYYYIQWIFPVLLIISRRDIPSTRSAIVVCAALLLNLYSRYWLVGETILFIAFIMLFSQLSGTSVNLRQKCHAICIREG